MNRRDALKAMAAGIAGVFVPKATTNKDAEIADLRKALDEVNSYADVWFDSYIGAEDAAARELIQAGRRIAELEAQVETLELDVAFYRRADTYKSEMYDKLHLEHEELLDLHRRAGERYVELREKYRRVVSRLRLPDFCIAYINALDSMADLRYNIGDH